MSPSLLPASRPTCPWAEMRRGPEVASSCKWAEREKRRELAGPSHSHHSGPEPPRGSKVTAKQSPQSGGAQSVLQDTGLQDGLVDGPVVH